MIEVIAGKITGEYHLEADKINIAAHNIKALAKSVQKEYDQNRQTIKDLVEALKAIENDLKTIYNVAGLLGKIKTAIAAAEAGK